MTSLSNNTVSTILIDTETYCVRDSMITQERVLQRTFVSDVTFQLIVTNYCQWFGLGNLLHVRMRFPAEVTSYKCANGEPRLQPTYSRIYQLLSRQDVTNF